MGNPTCRAGMQAGLLTLFPNRGTMPPFAAYRNRLGTECRPERSAGRASGGFEPQSHHRKIARTDGGAEYRSCIARTNASVLITGESGTGKEPIAEAIHINSQRTRQPL